MTRALLQGMQGARLKDGEYADVEDLFGYAKDEVTQLAKSIGGLQAAETITPGSSKSFAIGRFSPTECELIKLPSKKPRRLRPRLSNDKLRYDNLKLETLLAAALRGESRVTTREAGRIVSVDAIEVPDAITPSGGYTIDGDTVTVTMLLVKNNEPVGRQLTRKSSVADTDSLIKQLAEMIVGAAK